MPQVRDTAVKLFGWTITSGFHDSSDKEDSSSSSSSLRLHMMNNQSASHNSEQDNPSLKTLSDLDNVTKETSDNSNDQHSEITTATTSEEKTTDLKKPDKILPCPRCNSVDTKFCYYNNYNVNQPRHFCRNCQRYWTSGGTMRTVPVGSGRRKNKGWVSSDHYLNITSDNTNNDYTNSSTKFLSFESSEYFVTKKDKHQSTDANITADSISQKSNNFQGFLPPQVTSHASPTWPYPYPPSPSFYHLPVYWGYMEPVWSTLATSTCLGKRTRDESSHKSVKESKAAFVKFRTKREKTDQFTFFLDGSETKSSNKSFFPEPYLTLQANPAAMARSMNFREST